MINLPLQGSLLATRRFAEHTVDGGTADAERGRYRDHWFTACVHPLRQRRLRFVERLRSANRLAPCLACFPCGGPAFTA